ncbi:hypothetical protein KAU33_12770 [Candidatus Dependentiae bacterium]|nr:hypothetical protein [Candidatus Dependentiae bacterium]
MQIFKRFYFVVFILMGLFIIQTGCYKPLGRLNPTDPLGENYIQPRIQIRYIENSKASTQINRDEEISITVVVNNNTILKDLYYRCSDGYFEVETSTGTQQVTEITIKSNNIDWIAPTNLTEATFLIQVSDINGNKDSQSYFLDIVNSVPEILSFTATPTTVTSLGQTIALAIATDDDLGITLYEFFASPPQGVFNYNSNTQTASIQVASAANTISLDWIAESVLHGAPYDQKITVIVTDTDSETATAEIILPTNIP